MQGLRTVCGAGCPLARSGVAVHVYACSASMVDRCLQNADGDLLLVPQLGTLDVHTELGRMTVAPNEICIIPANVRFEVKLVDAQARGYALEVWGTHFEVG